MKLLVLLSFGEFMTQYGLIIALSLAGTVFLTVLVLFIISLLKKKQARIETISKKSYYNKERILEALGGKDNIVSKSMTGSRISLELKDFSLVNELLLQAEGVDSIIRMSKKITLIIKGDVSGFYKVLF